jgi:hypothetical protein
MLSGGIAGGKRTDGVAVEEAEETITAATLIRHHRAFRRAHVTSYSNPV